MSFNRLLVVLGIGVLLSGCRLNQPQRVDSTATIANPSSSQWNLTRNRQTDVKKNDVALADFQQSSEASPQISQTSASTLGNVQDTDDPIVRPVITPESISGRPTGREQDPIVPNSAQAKQPALKLDQVLTSVQDCFPEIEAAIGEIETASGKVLASWGQFDRVVSAHSISQPLGFYQTFRNGMGLSRPLFGGGEVYGTYRIGDGNFEPWYGERETNEAGEFKAGFSLPLLKDRDIDQRRANLFSSELERKQVAANVESRLLLFQRFATQAYWDWVATGQSVQIQKRLIALAEARVDQIKNRIDKGDLAKIAQIDNDRFIAKRKNDLIKSRRALQKAAIKLSLFWRDSNCQPVIATEQQLPTKFPVLNQISQGQLGSDIAYALTVRPELSEFVAARRQALVECQYAQNLTLPKVDVKGFAGQDIGGETSSKGDKTPFELQLGLFFEVPLERREGLGKIQVAQGKLTQIDAKMRFMSDKIRAEIQDAASAVNAAFDQAAQSTKNLILTRRSLELAKIAFRSGDIDLIALNIYETAVADAELQLLDAQFKYFFYRAIYQTAIRGVAFSR